MFVALGWGRTHRTAEVADADSFGLCTRVCVKPDADGPLRVRPNPQRLQRSPARLRLQGGGGTPGCLTPGAVRGVVGRAEKLSSAGEVGYVGEHANARCGESGEA